MHLNDYKKVYLLLLLLALQHLAIISSGNDIFRNRIEAEDPGLAFQSQDASLSLPGLLDITFTFPTPIQLLNTRYGNLNKFPVTSNGSFVSSAEGLLRNNFEKRKPTCISGKWVKPHCKPSPDFYNHTLHKTCKLNHHPLHSIITYRYKELKVSKRTLFPHGSLVSFRCEGQIGEKWKMDGSSRLVCKNGNWDKRIPRCTKTSSAVEFSDVLSPSLSIHTDSGYSTIGPAGHLIVYPGSSMHFDCLFNRKLGTPKWTWLGNKEKYYTTGWIFNATKNEWRFRISLYNILLGDSNKFTCQTPRGKINKIKMQVTDVECQELKITNMELESRLQSKKIGSEAHFSCPTGLKIIGNSKMRCLSNGQWSSSTPSCSPVRCQDLEMLDPRLRLTAFNNSFQGLAIFQCPHGYKLIGPQSLTCGFDEKWRGTPPSCQAVQCPDPLPIVRGSFISGKNYFVGNMVQYVCDEGFVLVGEPFIRCTQDGIWSHSTPFCKRVCRYPGGPENGKIAPIKFSYEIGDKVLVQCDSGYVNTGRQKLQCTYEGTWSDFMPSCLSYLT